MANSWTPTKKVMVVRDVGAASIHGRPSLSSSQAAQSFWKDYFKANPNYDQERVLIVTLDTKHRVMAVYVITVGTLDASLVHPREVFKPAIIDGSSAIVMCHNHPSGDPKPSREDINITQKMEECGKQLGITLLDHIVYGDGDGTTLSTREEGF